MTKMPPPKKTKKPFVPLASDFIFPELIRLTEIEDEAEMDDAEPNGD